MHPRAASSRQTVQDESTRAPGSGDAEPRPRKRLSWPELMQRVFAVDVLRCPQCGGAMRIIAEIHPPDTTRAILAWVGLPARAPPLPPPDPAPAAFAFDPFEPA